MKPIVSYFIVALFISGCAHQANHLGETPPQLPDKTRPETSTNPQQALVIGNSDYEYTPLSHSLNDAKDMADALEQMGFEVTLKLNLNNQAMIEAFRDFGKRLSTTPEVQVGLFYFSGHSAQVDGQNFMLPINNSKINGEKDLKPNAVHAKTILDEMAKANNGVRIIILDACYKNPYRQSNKSQTQGLARISPPSGALIAFATEENQTVSDVEGRNGLYTKHLLTVLEEAEHNRIEDVFMEVNELVMQESGGKQTPWYQATLIKPFCLGGCL